MVTAQCIIVSEIIDYNYMTYNPWMSYNSWRSATTNISASQLQRIIIKCLIDTRGSFGNTHYPLVFVPKAV